MDSLTHILLGGALAQVAAGRRAGGGVARSFWLGGLAATLPDFDVFIHTGNAVRDHALHRHFMHSLVMVPVLALAAWAIFMVDKRARPFGKPLYVAALLACLSHTILDALTSYGTVTFWPFTERRIAFDTIAIIDPLYTLPLLAGVIVAAWKKSARPAAVGLIVSTFYMGLALVQHERAAGVQRQLIASRGATNVQNARVLPQLGSLLLYRSVYLHNGRIFADAIRPGLFGGAQVKTGGSLPQIAASDLRPFPATPDMVRNFDSFAWFSDGFVARSPTHPALIADLRYSLAPEGLESIWGVQLEDTPEPRWLMQTRGRGMLERLWSETFHPQGYVPAATLAAPAAP